MSQEQIDQAKDLIKQINHYDHEYFTNNRSLISDEQYDNLWFQLKDLLAIDDVKKALKKTDMPLGEQTSHLAKIKHLMPVLSLDKIKWDSPKFQKQLANFDQKYGTDHKYSVQSKLDGLTIVIYKYHGDVTFATRGGGVTGENVTDQFKNIKPLWDAAQNIPEGMMVRGEAIIPKADFEAINQSLHQQINVTSAEIAKITDEYQPLIDQLLSIDTEKSDNAEKKLKASIKKLKSDKSPLADQLTTIIDAADNLYANARNLASASVRTLDTTTAEKHHVKMILYDVMNSEMFDLKTENECLDKLASFGFETVKNQLMTFDELQDWFKSDKPNEWRDSEPVEIDGIVIKPDVKIEHPDLTKHHQKGEIAVKYPPETKPSILRSVSWTVGSAGRLTPVANFDPVALGGSLVKAASLGSWNTIQKLGLKIGDHVIIERSNDVIPQIRSVETSQRTGDETDIEFPKDAILNGGIIYSLSAQLPLPDLCARYCKTVKIDGAGKGFWKKIIEQTDFVQSLHDIYNFHRYADDLADVNGIGQKKIDQVREQIRLSVENTTFAQALLGLNQPGLGERAVQQFVTIWPSCEDFVNESDDDFEQSLKKFGDLNGVNSLAVNGVKYLHKHHQELSALCSYLIEA